MSPMRAEVLPLCIGLIMGIGLGEMIWKPKAQKLEAPAPAARQTDGSLILERKADLSAKPVHQIPTGAKVERLVQVTVQPRVEPAPAPSSANVAPAPISGGSSLVAENLPLATPCPPVRVDLALIRMTDQTRRVVASSPDGDVVGGLDVPVEPERIPADPKWVAAGLVGFDLRQSRRVFGVMISRQAGAFSIHAGAIGQTAFLGAGVRF